MIEEAIKTAREVAEKFAKDSQSKLGKIKKASQGLFTINVVQEHYVHEKSKSFDNYKILSLRLIFINLTSYLLTK
jgi:hypothetical protein